MTFSEVMADGLTELMLEGMGLDPKNARVTNLLNHLYRMGYIEGEWDMRQRELDRLLAVEAAS